MLNFRNVNIAFIGLAALAVCVGRSYHTPVYTYALLIILYGLLLFYGCYYIGSNYFIPTICSIKTQQKIIALSFDDGPDPVNTPQILEILKTNNVEASFFCIGSKIAGNQDILMQIYKQGHIIGNHSFSHHFWFDLFPAKKMIADMQMMDSAVDGEIGVRPKLFRPPYGVTNPNVKKAIVAGNYTPVGWSVRSYDTVVKNEAKLLNNMMNKLKPGAVFLFHDTSNTSLAILPEFIKQVKLKGYELSRLDKMLNLQAYV